MTSTLLKYNIILIVLCIGITLINNSSGDKVKLEINLYYDSISPSCRSVLLTLEALNLEVNLIYISLLAREQLTEDFHKINPLHTLPVLQGNDIVLLNSHTIIVYLVQFYGGNDHPLYPNNPKLQAQINQRLFFDNGNFSPAFAIQYDDKVKQGKPIIVGKDKIPESLMFLEKILEESTWTASNVMTVADFALVASISTFQVAGVDLEKYENIKKWFSKCKTTMEDYDRANQYGIDEIMAIR